ncbi:Adenosine 3'-phospho 5'-phosphosulfate transporter 2 [Armadillidium nasatum]|uniref:Adenosine 3'-phospho 5'-phosphosulfate transporter 2 n=1 Tax=Armadillidium nasatum TaxID=96803 RepID=A0A5N5TFX1_9CRUS|nr:Adenosine 3'-phospho 5'-phosphosulfate transporter 2 [Armadillidium nasatum]
MLELIFTLEGMTPYGWYLTLVQFGFYSLFAFFQMLSKQKKLERNIPLQTYLLIAVLTVGTMGFSNSSMGYLNFPTQVIFKSCKLIPVMIGSMIILKKSYNILQVAACLLMTIGLIWFTLADSVVQPSFNVKGVILISSALLCDAVIGNVQEGAMKTYNENSVAVVFYSYSFGFLLIFLALILSGTFFPAIYFSLKHPWELYGRCVFLSFTGFCGVQAVLLLIKKFGAVAAVTVTTFRKALSICLSFLIFVKPFSFQYVWSGILVGLGVYLSVIGKNYSSGSIIIALQKFIIRFSSRKSPKISLLDNSMLINIF